VFDFVIIERAAFGHLTDSTVLINQADGASWWFGPIKPRYKEVDRILEMLPRERMLGAVLNHLRALMMKLLLL
jgi:hypothetical protein